MMPRRLSTNDLDAISTLVVLASRLVGGHPWPDWLHLSRIVRGACNSTFDEAVAGIGSEARVPRILVGVRRKTS